MYSKLITTIIGICAFFGMLIFAGTALKDKDIGLTTPENADNHKTLTEQTAEAVDSVGELPETIEVSADAESSVFYDVDSTPKASDKKTTSEAAASKKSTLEQTASDTSKSESTASAEDTANHQANSNDQKNGHTENKKTTASNTPEKNDIKTNKAPQQAVQSKSGSAQIDPAYINVLLQAETNAPDNAKRILQTARKMALTDKEIIQGSCWDYINAVYDNAGFPKVKRRQLFNGEYKAGPYADQNLFQPADWLYFVNHSYKDVEHSSLFIGWTDRANNKALMLTYGGENRAEPARYRVYDLSHVYGIIRPSAQSVTALKRPTE